ncbi:membrane protein [Streptomyces sulfonofaciens]|uniref:Membrane protein n=1 Tax=Streptomyces sulfonofaciens TaxID=68272 RepID=A0A919FRX8_9ACTN|nr:glycosyltransferase family 39 protein [Streptomyces sulfonofaciens]GHH70863.1 membrane protein [Streptomyces sulfonofaciens]
MNRTTTRTAATATPYRHARPSQQPATTGPDRRRGLRRTVEHQVEHHGPVLAVYGTLKLVGFAAFMWLLHSGGDYRTKHPRFGGGAHPWDVLASWDGWWYQQIAAHGYDPRLIPIPGATGPITLEGNSAAFFPLYPALMRLVSELTGLGLYGAGLLVSVVASFAAALGVYTLTERLGGRRAGLAAAGLWAVWPGSGVEWALYSDSLYVALAVWACHAVLSRRWLTAGLLTCVAGLNRPTAAALIAAVAAAALLALHRRRDGILRPVAAMAVAPLGLLAYLGWVGHRTGQRDGYFRLQSGAWAHEWDFGRHTLDVLSSVPVGHFDYPFAWPFEDLVGVGVVLLALVLFPLLLRLRPPVVLVVHTVLTLVLVLGSRQIFGNVSRYLLPLFPLFLPLALALRRLSPTHQTLLLGIAALASGSYAGYGLFELGVP